MTTQSNIITHHKTGRPQESVLLSTVGGLKQILALWSDETPTKIRLCLHCSKLLLQRHSESNALFAKRKCCNGQCGQLMRQERERKARLSKRALNQRKREARIEKKPNP